MPSKDLNCTFQEPSNAGKPVLLLQIEQLMQCLSGSQNSVCHRTLSNFSNSFINTPNTFGLLFPIAQCSSNKNLVPQDIQTTRVSAGEEFKMPGFSSQATVPGSSHGKDITGYQINDWMAQETGLDRLKQAYSIRDWQFCQEDTKLINLYLLKAAPFVFGAGLYLEGKYVAHERSQQKNIFNRKVKGSTGYRLDTWNVWKKVLMRSGRLALASAIIFNLSHSIAVYQNETTIEGMALSTVIAFATYYIGSGPKVLLKELCRGAVVGVLGGFCVNQYLVLAGMVQEQRHKERVNQLILDKRSSTENSENELL